MPRKKKAQLPVVQIERNGAIYRTRKLAGFCKENPEALLNANEVLNYLNSSGKGENPADTITINKDKTVEFK